MVEKRMFSQKHDKLFDLDLSTFKTVLLLIHIVETESLR